MRLAQIKLAGFKSFVDPTTIPVPGQLVAVCGPNGCGKSNVIDAVRWVLGESSARQLRGESMQDVIFNGATTRKPVSRASVELVFDNREGRASGPFGQYAEIAIRRQLTRQGESSYFINNIQCRRRDIADLFLGTGVGARGYAVIEQGMIARIIEARPEELRAFLEEAAGVSKYKERRRETESRLNDTRDNLARVADIQQELDQQLMRLAAQAEVAAEFQLLKSRIVEKQNLLALRRKRDAAEALHAAEQAMAAAETALEAHTARLRACEAEIELRREQHYATSDDVQRAQMHLADASATVARMEQQLLHLREKRQRLTQQVNQAKAQLDQLSAQRAQMEADAARLEEEATTAAEARLDAEAVLLALQEALPEHEAASEAARVALESAQLTLSHLRQTRQLAEQQVLHLERAMAQLLQRRDRLMAEQQALPSPDADALEDARLALETLSLVLEDATLELSALESALQTAEVERHEARQQRDATRTAYTAAHARHEALARLQAAQPAAGALRDWLARHGLADAPRLFEHLRIAPGWARAVEAVLRDRMQARCLPGTPTAEAPPARLTWIHREAVSAVTVTPCPPELLALGQPLRAQVEAPTQFAPVLDDWLDRVLAVADDAALARVQPQLPPGWLAVAPSGHAASRHARIYHADDEAHAGLLQRQTEIAELAAHMATLAATLETLESRLHTAEEAVGQHHARLKHVRQRVDALRQQRGEQQVALARLTQAQEQADARRRQLADELADLQAEAETLALERETATLERDAASIGLPDAERAVEQARLACTEAETVLDLHRSRLRQAERQVQEMGFACQSAAQQRAALVRRLDDLAQQAEETRMRREDASFELAEMDEGSFNDSFQVALDARAERERALAAARDAANQATNRLREAELEKQQIEQGFEPIREQLGSLQLKAQEARLSLERFEQELREAGADETALAPLLNEGVKVQQLVGEIGRLSQQIHALGNVNLAAIDELKAAQARKTYLDAQADDLNAAIETLESAIRKIDRETRTMLQDTFNQVNANLQELFPMLFGGGHAELMLTGEEILDAGVQIMAQPPGKKNATIHLLSGGEKALTALSLVFALFRLNPAPFCLLDEVDAPLDDANTSRFCEMVKRMAERTQFLYISHNKLTMEMADQLVGITMQEKGVSRVVAVDIEAALQMRETA